MFGQMETRPRGLYLDCTSMDDPVLVSSDYGNDDRYTNSSPQGGEPVAVAWDSENSSTVRKDGVDGLSLVGRALKDRNVSKRASNIIMASWRSGTKKQYSTHIKKWFSYCDKRKVNHFQTDLNSVLDFLSELFENGNSYSAVNTARSALSAIGIIIDGFAVGSHPLVVRFMKGVYN